MKYTMQNIREMKPWSDTELIAYARACEAFKEQNVEGTNKIPNFKNLFKAELKKFSKKSATKTIVDGVRGD